MKKLEIVCLGNNGRSPIGEAVFKEEAKRFGVETELEITSSGLYVEKRHPLHIIVNTMIKYIGSDNPNFYTETERRKASFLFYLIQDESGQFFSEEQNLMEGFYAEEEGEKIIHNIFDQAYVPLRAMDVALRDVNLSNHGLKYASARHQFPSAAGLDYVLTATNKLVEPAKEMVGQTDTYVTSLSEFTGVPDVEGGFGKFDIDVYDKMYQNFRKAAPIAIEKIMRGER